LERGTWNFRAALAFSPVLRLEILRLLLVAFPGDLVFTVAADDG
jgi:hypothetical protein